MADMYDTPCFPSLSPAEPDDDGSLFLHQTLLRSSSSPSPSCSLMAQTGRQVNCFSPSHLPTQDHHRVPDRISTADSSSVLNLSADAVLSSPCGFFPATVCNMSSSSVGTLDNDADDYDCDSEEGFEAMAADEPTKPVQHRHSSKRSRAAEVHNLSEKRRRSRINEKMKALQNLIPNSNKTDKASMLDEAIEYLKQLQLQVQMLTMRNGLSLYPMCIPGVLQQSSISQMRMGFFEGNGSLDMNSTGTLTVNKETPTSRLFNLSNQSPNPNQPSVANLANIVSLETPVGLQSSIQDHLIPFQLHTSSQGICSEDLLQHQHLHADRSDAYPLDFQMGEKSTMSIPFETQPSNLKDNALESCIVGRDRAEGLLLTNLECDPVLPPQLNGLDIGRSGANSETGRLNF